MDFWLQIAGTNIGPRRQPDRSPWGRPEDACCEQRRDSRAELLEQLGIGTIVATVEPVGPRLLQAGKVRWVACKGDCKGVTKPGSQELPQRCRHARIVAQPGH